MLHFLSKIVVFKSPYSIGFLYYIIIFYQLSYHIIISYNLIR